MRQKYDFFVKFQLFFSFFERFLFKMVVKLKKLYK